MGSDWKTYLAIFSASGIPSPAQHQLTTGNPVRALQSVNGNKSLASDHASTVVDEVRELGTILMGRTQGEGSAGTALRSDPRLINPAKT